jgi:predicted ABC-type ATPase
MILLEELDRRPAIVALAGPNGAGKTTFYHAHLERIALRFVNADVIAATLELDPLAGAAVADAIRRQLVARRESFVFETVFSDPAGEKLAFLRAAASSGYTVVLCYVGLASAAQCRERVAMRVSQGGHDVPVAKLRARYDRTLVNLARAVRELPHVLVFDNRDLGRPFRRVAAFRDGRPVFRAKRAPAWLRRALAGE